MQQFPMWELASRFMNKKTLAEADRGIVGGGKRALTGLAQLCFVL
jgi:hypothetical protein